MSEQAIYARLNSEVAALGGRIYPMVLPQNIQYPAATYQRIPPTTRYRTFGGYVPLVSATIQVDVYARRDLGYSSFKTIYDAVRDSLKQPPGSDLDDIFLEDEDDDYEDDTDLFRRRFDVGTTYEES